MENVGVRLRQLRGKTSPKAAAREIGVTEAALLAYEKGKRQPRDEVRIRAALYYGVPGSFLRDARGEAAWKS